MSERRPLPKHQQMGLNPEFNSREYTDFELLKMPEEKRNLILESDEVNPCRKEEFLVMQCLRRTLNNSEECKPHMRNNKLCRSFWIEVTRRRVANGLPAVPHISQRQQIKDAMLAEFMEQVEKNETKWARFRPSWHREESCQMAIGMPLEKSLIKLRNNWWKLQMKLGFWIVKNCFRGITSKQWSDRLSRWASQFFSLFFPPFFMMYVCRSN